MSKFTYVTWKTKDGKRGYGQVISDESESRVQVAVYSWDSQNPNGIPNNDQELEVHPIIYCTVTWLTPIPAS